jgi:hypothetical protein
VPDIILSSEDVTVFGGPSTLNVEVDFGPTGDRGSSILVGLGKPTDVQTTNVDGAKEIDGQVFKIYDMYLNLLASDDEYLSLYQYHNISGINTWDQLVSFAPNNYVRNTQKTFNAGSTTINVDVSKIDPSAVGLDASHFSVQHSIVNNINPVSSSCSIGAVFDDAGILSLPITIKAIEYDGTSWANLSGSKMVHLLINVV